MFFFSQQFGQLGFGKSIPSLAVWIGNLPKSTTRNDLRMKLEIHGTIEELFIDQLNNTALLFFQSVDTARKVIQTIKTYPDFQESRLQVSCLTVSNKQLVI